MERYIWKTVDDYDNSGNLLTKSVINMKNDDIIKTDTYQYSNNNWEDQLTKFNDINITYDEIWKSNN